MKALKITAVVVGTVVVITTAVAIGSAGHTGSTTVPAVAGAASAAGASVASAAMAAGSSIAAAVPASSVKEGTYQVGVDLAAGRYKTPGPDKDDLFPSCFWSREKDDSGSFSSIIANDILRGPGSVTVKKGEFLKLSGSCTWTLQ